jgi:hypothetical protein
MSFIFTSYRIKIYFKKHRKEKKPELNVVLNESLNTINKGNGNKVSSVGIIVFHVEAT